LFDIACDASDKLLVSIANDKTLKVFDVVNFDMINMIKLKFVPAKCVWIHSLGDAVQAIAVTDSESPRIFVYDAAGGSKPLRVLDKLHMAPVTALKYNAAFCTVISVDKAGMLEYWSSAKYDFAFPDKDRVAFDSKLDTDLYEFAKNKATVHDIAFTPNGRLFATISSDRKIRVFKFATGAMIRVYDETLQHCSIVQQSKQIVPSMEFGRRMAIERELEKFDQLQNETIQFDQSGYFIFYPTMFGIKLVNWYTNKCLKIIGKGENLRPLCISLYQNMNTSKSKAALTIEMMAANNPNLEETLADPSLFTSAYKKNRFYIFSRRDPEDVAEETIVERDIFNEKPTKDDILAATEANTMVKKLFDSCVMHTSSGDVHIKLFPHECPKTVENFCVHAKNNYYNGHIFHRVIKQFMIQTGDPTGTGSGGESIWGHEFEDEFHPNVRHDKPYSLSMANAGANTNGSQFFVTVVPCPWLDNKHTVFGRVVKGMEVVQAISNVRTNPKTDKPYDDVKIVSITLK
jgi:peptidylprolyl isomerase domain and WD repeat-containing protein 1